MSDLGRAELIVVFNFLSICRGCQLRLLRLVSALGRRWQLKLNDNAAASVLDCSQALGSVWGGPRLPFMVTTRLGRHDANYGLIRQSFKVELEFGMLLYVTWTISSVFHDLRKFDMLL